MLSLTFVVGFFFYDCCAFKINLSVPRVVLLAHSYLCAVVGLWRRSQRFEHIFLSWIFQMTEKLPSLLAIFMVCKKNKETIFLEHLGF